jgi:hypothetical protein
MQFRRLIAVALCGMAWSVGALAQFSKDTLQIADAADLWWIPQEAGWGMQIVQGGDVLFATLFVYDAAGQPTFFTATLETTPQGWSGDLYRTTGPYFGAPNFDPTTVTLTKVGTMSFGALVNNYATLQYSVNGVNVTKQVQRQVLRFDDYNGRYPGTLTLTMSNCPDPAMNTTTTTATTIAIRQSSELMAIGMTLTTDGSCNYNGTYDQVGHVGSFSSTFNCDSGANGAMSFYSMTNRSGVIAGRFQGHATSDGCDYRGRFVGLAPE